MLQHQGAPEEGWTVKLDCCGLAAVAGWGGRLEHIPPAARHVSLGWNAPTCTAPEIRAEADALARAMADAKDKKQKKGVAPLQAPPLAKAAAPAADVYAFGVVLWEIFAGQVHPSGLQPEIKLWECYWHLSLHVEDLSYSWSQCLQDAPGFCRQVLQTIICSSCSALLPAADSCSSCSASSTVAHNCNDHSFRRNHLHLITRLLSETPLDWCKHCRAAYSYHTGRSSVLKYCQFCVQQALTALRQGPLSAGQLDSDRRDLVADLLFVRPGLSHPLPP